MELTSQKVQNRVREIGINPNYWYPVAWAKEIKPTFRTLNCHRSKKPLK
ncbi:hypothetical protein IQ231_17070 [Cuspidothrix issatschenkoi LEGE 03284]|nr:hypothetical protein [Cuspidothrix issatschenkoi]MBE9233336.1 hypothetical protein [Cuspidothrix issatschenkoi LEGE 03284]